MNNGLGIFSQDSAPSEWAEVIPALSGLTNLRTLIITFPSFESRPDVKQTDEKTVEVAKRVLQGLARSQKDVEKSLVVRRVVAPHYENGFKRDTHGSLEVFQF